MPTENSPGPTIVLADMLAAYIGHGLPLRPHRKAVITISISLDRPFVLELHSGRSAELSRQATAFAMIQPRQLHRIVSDGEMMFIYVDATRRIADVDAVAATTIARTATRMAANGETPIAMVRSCVRLLGLDRKGTPDPRFAAAIAMLNMQPDRMRTVAQAAGMSALSASHFQRKLRENYGVSFRAYRNWARMSFVMQCIKEGATLTNAALAAGFSSSAHFSERFRSMFGVSLSSLQRANGRIVTITDQ